MRSERIIDPAQQPERHAEHRLGVKTRRELEAAQRASDRRTPDRGVVVGNGAVTLGRAVRRLQFPAGGAQIEIDGDTATVWNTVLIKAGAPSDSDFSSTPPNGTLALDSTNHRLYIRDGGTWRYAALT